MPFSVELAVTYLAKIRAELHPPVVPPSEPRLVWRSPCSRFDTPSIVVFCTPIIPTPSFPDRVIGIVRGFFLSPRASRRPLLPSPAPPPLLFNDFSSPFSPPFELCVHSVWSFFYLPSFFEHASGVVYLPRSTVVARGRSTIGSLCFIFDLAPAAIFLRAKFFMYFFFSRIVLASQIF